MSIKLKGSTDGSVILKAPADTSPTGTDKTFTLPTADGTSGQVLQTNGSGALSFGDKTTNTQISRGTAVNLTGTSVQFTGIASDVRRITLVFLNVSMNSTDDFEVQIGDSGGIETSGYVSWNKRFGGTTFSTGGSAAQTGYLVGSALSLNSNYFGEVIIYNPKNNDWVCTSQITDQNDNFRWQTGKKSLSDTLTQVNIKCSGTASFDAGYVQIFTETA